MLVVLAAVIVVVVLGIFLSGGSDDEDAPARVAAVENDAEPEAKQDAAANSAASGGASSEASDQPENAQADLAQKADAQQRRDSAEEARAAGEAPGGEMADGGAPKTAVMLPSFDVVRVSPSGRAVIAGRAELGAEVTVLDDGIPIGSVRADKRGEWVLVPENNLESGDRELSLVQDLPNGDQVMSQQVVVLSVPVPRDKPVATAAAEAAGVAAEVAGEETQVTVVEIGEEDAETLDTAPGDKNAEEGAIAVLVEREGDGPSRILQGPDVAGEGIGDEADVSIRTVDYDAEGEVTLAGRTEPNAVVNVYVDEVYVGSAQANEAGDWQLSPEKEVQPGQHRLRIDKVDETGVVLARIETPISRARPEELLLGDALVVVQPGNSLWRIARRAYGGGTYYSEIYGANRAQILDPEMIFPGQILTLPVLN